jgi:hypothetical protein
MKFRIAATLLLLTASTASAALFPASARGVYRGTIRVVDTKYGVNVTTASSYRITANRTRFSTGRDSIRFFANGTATNPNWVSARYTTRRHSISISGEFRDSSDPAAGSAGSFRYIIHFKSGGVVTVASTSSYDSGGVQTVQFAGRD